MPLRREPLITGKIYHVFNRMISPLSEFRNNRQCKHFVDLMTYYRSNKSSIRFSFLKDLNKLLYDQIIKETALKMYFRVDILAYCLMPTHFHLLLRQREEDGISRFMGTITNAVTRHINIKRRRVGPVFLPRFKSVLIKTSEQLIHVCRYIHLNPYSAGLLEKIEELCEYPWSSYPEYCAGKSSICEIKTILSYFDFDIDSYKDFVNSNAEYQKTLEMTKHSLNWEQ